MAAVEAYLFASRVPVSEADLSRTFPAIPYKAALRAIEGDYADRGVMPRPRGRRLVHQDAAGGVRPCPGPCRTRLPASAMPR